MAIDRKARIGIEVVGEGEEDAAKKAADALEDIGTSGQRAGELMEKAGEKIARGASGGERAVIQAKGALDEYVRSLQAAEGAGAVIGEAELSKLHELEGAYERAVDEVGEFRAAQQQAKRDIEDATEAAGGQAERINSLSDIVRKVAEDLGPGATKWVSWGAAAAGAFTVGYQAGLKFKDVLDQISDGKFSEGIQRDLTNWLRLDTGINTVAEDAEVLKNQLNILRNQGLDPTGLSAAEVAAKVTELGMAHQKTSFQVAEAARGFKEYEKEQKAMIDGLNAQVKALDGLTGKALADQMRLLPAAIKEALDSLQDIVDAGGTIPPELQKIADAWGVVSTAADESAKRHVEIVRTIMSDIKGELVKTRPEIEAEAKALAAAIPDAFANMPPVQFLKPEEFERAQVVIRQMVNTFIQAGKDIPEALKQAALSVGVFNDAIAGINPGPMEALAERLGAALRKLQGDAMAAAGSLKQVFRDPLAQGDTQTERLDQGDGSWFYE